jgi:hypothetical protein
MNHSKRQSRLCFTQRLAEPLNLLRLRCCLECSPYTSPPGGRFEHYVESFHNGVEFLCRQFLFLRWGDMTYRHLEFAVLYSLHYELTQGLPIATDACEDGREIV